MESNMEGSAWGLIFVCICVIFTSRSVAFFIELFMMDIDELIIKFNGDGRKVIKEMNKRNKARYGK